MTALAWDASGSHLFETGVERGVLYPTGSNGVPWNGLISIHDSVLGGEDQAYYFDGLKYLDWIANEDFAGTIEAFGAPPEFGVCEGGRTVALGLTATQQRRQTFGLSYRTRIGNDVSGTLGYKLHLVYNALVSPSDRDYKTLSDNADPTTITWDFNCVAPTATTYKPTAHFIVNSTKANSTKLAALEVLLYGDATHNPALPDQATVIATLT